MENPSEQLPEKYSHRFKKEERLCSKKLIEKLFAEGDSFLVFPFKIVFVAVDYQGDYPAKAAFAVSKKLFKKAVHRNLIKRRIREAYRLNKHMLKSESASLKRAIIFIYIGKEILAFHQMERAMIRGLRILAKKAIQNP